MMIPEPTEITLKLMSNEIEIIIDELGRTEFNVYTFLNYNRIIEKLQNAISIKNEKERTHEKDERNKYP